MQSEISQVEVARALASSDSLESERRTTAKRPSISVILPNYNHGKWLRRSIGALVAQAVSSMEILLIDDGSTDNSLEVIADLCRQHDCIRLIQHDVNRGPYVAVRSGLAAARGEFLLLAAADDFILPGLLERAEAALRAHPGAAFFCSEVALVDRSGRVVSYRPVVPPRLASGYMSPDDMRREIRHTDNWFVGPSVVYRHARIAEIGYFDESLGTLCDGLATRLLGFRQGFYFDAKVLAVWMVDPASLSAQTSLSVTESCRVRDVGARWIADRFPADVRDSYAEIFGRRFRFNMARQRLIWRSEQVDTDAICGLLEWGPRERSLARILCRVPRIGPTLLLTFMTLRMRPISVVALIKRWWWLHVTQRGERAALQHRLTEACKANVA
jgi:glycosyltransferase involved in cell wall biosynthesis